MVVLQWCAVVCGGATCRCGGAATMMRMTLFNVDGGFLEENSTRSGGGNLVDLGRGRTLGSARPRDSTWR